MNPEPTITTGINRPTYTERLGHIHQANRKNEQPPTPSPASILINPSSLWKLNPHRQYQKTQQTHYAHTYTCSSCTTSLRHLQPHAQPNRNGARQTRAPPKKLLTQIQIQKQVMNASALCTICATPLAVDVALRQLGLPVAVGERDERVLVVNPGWRYRGVGNKKVGRKRKRRLDEAGGEGRVDPDYGQGLVMGLERLRRVLGVVGVVWVVYIVLGICAVVGWIIVFWEKVI
ncbi:hypothetical protein EV426DRAFT_706700 [Tirmania nivea]|nr:hypothetical protein EV426DRAFT_706700 [Tirmania nivea]